MEKNVCAHCGAEVQEVEWAHGMTGGSYWTTDPEAHGDRSSTAHRCDPEILRAKGWEEWEIETGDLAHYVRPE